MSKDHIVTKRKSGPRRGRRIGRHIMILPEMDELLADRALEIGLSKGQYIEHLLRNAPKPISF